MRLLLFLFVLMLLLPLFQPVLPHAHIPNLQIPKPLCVLGMFLGQKSQVDELESVEGAKRFADRLVSLEPGIRHEVLGYEKAHVLSIPQSHLSGAEPEA